MQSKYRYPDVPDIIRSLQYLLRTGHMQPVLRSILRNSSFRTGIRLRRPYLLQFRRNQYSMLQLPYLYESAARLRNQYSNCSHNRNSPLSTAYSNPAYSWWTNRAYRTSVCLLHPQGISASDYLHWFYYDTFLPDVHMLLHTQDHTVKYHLKSYRYAGIYIHLRYRFR